MGTFDERRIFEEWVAVHGRDCPSRTVIEALANKWALYVLGAIRRYERPMRFSELRRLLDGITQKMLTQTLRSLERDGLIRRDVYPTVPPRVEYGLTPLGVDVGRLTNAVAEWAVENVDQIVASRSAFDEKAAKAAQPL
ncbi:winged helix-turn-helix transcriptional regulator [Amycolatopsis decaplanina]|uniref:HxlR family transcriptional regulator n=1 Tax=Amycolatopsis decaplanina DSM 44594 TaxID=1284240 RepID=M2Z948_9PSEU|nr:helix-turn-helix domain-containing protein [Amycolatopsis decaplanina]EME63807.1 HxlR family transcriptional regulator [Amycolatopsis decaplanina DSM 44594]